MKMKTSVHVNLDLHFDSDDLANGAELARLAAVCDGLYMLIRAQRQEQGDVSQETPLPQLGTQPQQIEAQSVSQETPLPPEQPLAPPTKKPARRGPPRRDLDEFDYLVRTEMQRLAPDGILPTHARWDRERDRRLPTLVGVIRRHGYRNRSQLAQRLGIAPSQEDAPAPATNGQHEPRRRL